MLPLYEPVTSLVSGLYEPDPVAEPLSPGSSPAVIRKLIATELGAPPPLNVPDIKPVAKVHVNVPPESTMSDGLVTSTVACSNAVNAPNVASLPLPLKLSVKTGGVPPEPIPENVPEIGIVDALAGAHKAIADAPISVDNRRERLLCI
jgi:hypothetical protein